MKPAPPTDATGTDSPGAGRDARAVVPSPWPARHVAVVVTLLFALAILKGARLPNLWSATHMTFNYSGGFIRRGLVGELVRRIAGEKSFHYYNLVLVAIALFVAVGVALGVLVARVLATGRRDLVLVAAVLVFVASPALVFFIHIIGYLDYIGLFAFLLVILVSSRARRPFAIFLLWAPLGCVLALVHEAQALMFGPAVFFVMLCHVARVTEPQQGPRRARVPLYAAAVVSALVTVAASAIVSAFGTKSPATILALQSQIGRFANFPLRGDAFEALYHTTREVALTAIPTHWSREDTRTLLMTSVLAVLPGLAFLLWYGVRLIRRLPLARGTRRLLVATFIAATLAPELLHFLGWDSPRWNAITVIVAFCCVAALRLFFFAGQEGQQGQQGQQGKEGQEGQEGKEGKEGMPGVAGAGAVPPPPTVEPLTLTLAALAIVIGLTTSYRDFLFDGYVVRWFPFDDRWAAAAEVIRSHFTYIPRY